MRPATEGTLAALLDALPPSSLRESILVVVSTRPVNLLEEAERSARLSGGSARGLIGRVILLDAARGDLTDLIQFGESPSTTALQWHESQHPIRFSAPTSGVAPGKAQGPDGAPGAGAEPPASNLAAKGVRSNGETGP
jgi:hypothetical protein